ncbi:hypothetical protein CONCODRAFT_3983 [Conidiobolus coronatus NRRL 28638]|uniref:Uncharacterized protein n=1 Tax=Conidiobolus coronatus (strain ATCC 28846 / CBS 209.66 / NRRL 28638) TaxID=796925 RepID=A0A137PDM8_CONC2|nr:hypothetical protein CONCODRAFT_3983 [Conidiobolus coronatus NRRL 28638]|eukprot:KXN73097.1 hypothetical protein CONCODRAFT_3983 [Conidiobolus coronatus NRRL 28638]
MLALTSRFLIFKRLIVTANNLKFYSTAIPPIVQEKINVIECLSEGNSIATVQELYYKDKSYNSIYNRVQRLKKKVQSLCLSKENVMLIKDQLGKKCDESEYNLVLKPKLNHIMYNDYLLVLNYLKFNPNDELNWIDVELNSSKNNKNNINNAFEDVQMKTGRWSTEEISLFNLGLSQYPNDFTSISKLVGTRTSKQCFTRYLSHSKSDPNNIRWTNEEDEKLMEFYNKYGFSICKYIDLLPIKRPYPGILRRLKRLTTPGVYIDHKKLKSHLQDLVTEYDSNWDIIGRHFPNIDTVLLQGFWEQNWNLNNKKIPFSAEEDKELIDYVEKCGREWKKISSLLGLRSANSYMFRYQYLTRNNNNNNK